MTPAPLPVPGLADTIDQVLRSASAVLSPEEFAELAQLADAFVSGPGPALQARLEAFAKQQEAAGSNWMAAAWTRLYLEDRGPLQTTTNVGFQLHVPHYQPGIDGIVALIHQAAAVHLAEAAGATEPELGFRGAAISMEQFRCLNGGVRVPGRGCDSWQEARGGRADRSIGVLAHGRMWRVPLTGPNGQLRPAADLRAALEQICAASPGSGFAELSALGSDELAGLFQEIDSPQHRATVSELREMLFMVSIIEPDQLPAPAAGNSGTSGDGEHSSDTGGCAEIALLRALTVIPGTAWAYKPITYQVGLTHSLVAAHIEHSMIDGATLTEAWRRVIAAPATTAPAPEASAAEPSTPEPSTALPPRPEPPAAELCELTWALTDEQRSRVSRGVEQARERAQQIEAARVVIPRPFDEDQPFRSSSDARAQLIAQCAQQLTYGRIRGVYEAVDMREFQAGRTEALRSVTPESVEFAAALADGAATRDQLDAALGAHRAWVKRVKQGAGMDRHLLMLQESAQDPDPFLSSPLLQRVREDFLSTSSLGGADQIIRFLFAPTCRGGFGVNYTMYSDRGEYLVTWRRGEAEQPHAFLQNLQRAGELFWAFVRGQAAPE